MTIFRQPQTQPLSAALLPTRSQVKLTVRLTHDRHSHPRLLNTTASNRRATSHYQEPVEHDDNLAVVAKPSKVSQ
ncbi:hypothetical protein MTBPR1_90174 [Candidatus Terasakiella magnetica]|uniref:Uncharacterized protein n=1 Tax=Candidatus Terasakiella magnetica TaxID=1867952 RepID=A0A1C3RM13_9PROT|nr:hypothetical protein MTBPR1_90174 [Candidatus Terasakiella magnetica]